MGGWEYDFFLLIACIYVHGLSPQLWHHAAVVLRNMANHMFRKMKINSVNVFKSIFPLCFAGGDQKYQNTTREAALMLLLAKLEMGGLEIS